MAKVCRDCGASDSDKTFRKQRRHCMDCFNASNRKHNRSKGLRLQYGLTVEDYDRLLIQQDSRCAICRKHYSKEYRAILSVDHCHSTGAIRGLLCGSCNRGLGMFADNPETINRAAAYLRREG